jgi:uncharacterized HhH-GPD family protein
MAKRVQAMCQLMVDTYDGDAARVWTTAADGKELLKRVAALPGFGTQKAKIFVALLGKQLGVTPPGWREACAPFGDAGSYRSIADIVDISTRDRVRDFKRFTVGRRARSGTATHEAAAVGVSRADHRGLL